MTTRRRSRAGFGHDDLFVTISIVALLVGLLLPVLSGWRQHARRQQNATQLRGIHQGMFTFAQNPYAIDGFYPGLRFRTGLTVPVSDRIDADELGASAAVPGYAAEERDRVLPGGMNTTPERGFITRAFAELVAGHFIPGGGAGFFVPPVDEVKHPFVPGAGEPFIAANVGYTTLDLSRSDGGVFPLTTEWGESFSTRSILLADRAVGDGSDPSTRSSVWTEPGSGRWRGHTAHNDGSVAFRESVAAAGLIYGRGASRVEAPVIDNLFSDTLRLEADAAGGTRVSADSGLLYDEADSGTDPDAF